MSSSTPPSDKRLSSTEVEAAFVDRVYGRLAALYDWVFGPTLHPGRVRAMEAMAPAPGDEVLEVGIGTGINLDLYPDHCRVTGLDYSMGMLARAHRRLVRRPTDGAGPEARLLRMDGAALGFADDVFDLVYAPYVVSVVPDPVALAREMVRVARPGGRVVILNHFKSPNPVLGLAERVISPLTVHIGFKTDLDLPRFLDQAGLEPESIEGVNWPPIWSLVTCVKPPVESPTEPPTAPPTPSPA